MSGLETLMEMGFSKEKAERAFAVTGGQDVETAMEWLLAHADELDTPQSQAPVLHLPGAATVNQAPAIVTTDSQQQSASVEQASNESNVNMGESSDPQQEPGHGDPSQNDQAKSLKCDDCGQLFRTAVEVEFHAAKSGHQNFSESTAEIKPLTEEEKKEKLRLLEEKIKERRLQKEAEEKREQINKEKVRRKAGQEVLEAKRKNQEAELMKIAEERRREKMEDKLARKRVLDQIASDKAARLAKLSNQSGATDLQPVVPPPEPTPASAAQPRNYDKTKIQIRLPNGTTLTQTFGAKEQLAAVRLFVEMNRTDAPGPFTFMTTFPKKVFSSDDMEVPLQELGLVPSAVLILTKVVEDIN